MRSSLFLLPLFAAACGIDIQNSSSGPVVRQDRAVADFHSVRLIGSLDLEVDVGGDTAVAVVCGEDVLDDVLTEVADGVLTVRIRDDASWNIRGTCDVHARTPSLAAAALDGSGRLAVDDADGAFASAQLEGSGQVDVVGVDMAVDSVVLVGSGDVAIDGLRSTDVSVVLEGSGDIALHGTSRQAALTLVGSGGIDASELTADNATIVLTGSGDVSLVVTETVDVLLEGSGNVSVTGSPVAEVEIQGSGDVDVD